MNLYVLPDTIEKAHDFLMISGGGGGGGIEMEHSAKS